MLCVYFTASLLQNPFLSSVATNPIILRLLGVGNKKKVLHKICIRTIFGWPYILRVRIATMIYGQRFHIVPLPQFSIPLSLSHKHYALYTNWQMVIPAECISFAITQFTISIWLLLLPLTHICQNGPFYRGETNKKKLNNIRVGWYICVSVRLARLPMIANGWPFSYMDTWYLFNAPNIK